MRKIALVLLCTTALFGVPEPAEAGPAIGILLGAGAATFLGGAGAIITIGGTSLGLWGSFLLRAALGFALNALSEKPKGALTDRGYLSTVRASATDHQVIYGAMKTFPVVLFEESTGPNNNLFHRVLAFAGHEVDAFQDIYIDDEVATLDTDGEVTSPARFAGFIQIKEHLGSVDQLADTDLISASALWTTEHRCRGIAYLYVKLTHSSTAFPNGIPEVSAVVRGKKLYDPRTALTAWSDNPALCVRDYLTGSHGLAEESTAIDDVLVATAADVCDEVDTVDSSTRYTCNGAFTTQASPNSLLGSILPSMGGLLWYAQGKWRMKPAYWTAPVLDLDEDDLRDVISVAPRHSRRDNYNKIKGTFRGEETNWQVTDYPEVTQAAFLAADGGVESVLDIDLTFTDTSVEARRIARIALERNRQQITVSSKFGIRTLSLQVGDNVNLTNSRFGWTQKEFEVISWTFGIGKEMELTTSMSLRETAESIFDEIDDGIVYERDNTNLPSPLDVPDLGLTALATTKVVNEKISNVVVLTVTSGAAEAVDSVEVQFKLSSETDWSILGTGDIGLYEAIDLEKTTYDFRSRAINLFGIRGEWTALSNVESFSSLAPPQDVTDFAAEVTSGSIQLDWEPVADDDLSHYKIRHALEETGATWANATTAVNKVPRPGTSVSLPARPGSYMIMSFDKLGITAENYTTIVVPEADLEDFTTLLTQTDSTAFTGAKTDCSVVSSTLRITSPAIAPTVATYEFSTYIDATTVQRARIRLDINVVRHDTGSGLFDDLTGNVDSWPGLWDDLTGTAQFSDHNVISYIATTDDDPSGTPIWSSWKRFKAGDYSGRAFKFKIELKSTANNITPSITGLVARVEHN